MRASLFWDSGVFPYTFMLFSVMQLIFLEENFNARGAFLYPIPSMLIHVILFWSGSIKMNVLSKLTSSFGSQ